MSNSPSTGPDGPSKRFSESEHRSGRLFDEPVVPQMREEVGFEEVVEGGVAQLRPSGFVSMFLGLGSFVAVIATQMVAIPAAAIALGLYALRRYEGSRPVGSTPAILGVLLGAMFLAAGLAVPYFRQKTLGNQAAYFAKQYLEIVGDGQFPLATELKKRPVDRQIGKVNLVRLYDELARKQAEQGEAESADTGMGIYEKISQYGPDVKWELDRRPRVFVRWGIQKVDTYWRETSGKTDQVLQVLMQWKPDEGSEVGHWQVELFQYERERLVAESIL